MKRGACANHRTRRRAGVFVGVAAVIALGLPGCASAPKSGPPYICTSSATCQASVDARLFGQLIADIPSVDDLKTLAQQLQLKYLFASACTALVQPDAIQVNGPPGTTVTWTLPSTTRFNATLSFGDDGITINKGDTASFTNGHPGKDKKTFTWQTTATPTSTDGQPYTIRFNLQVSGYDIGPFDCRSDPLIVNRPS
jgi:hypothetical protein